MTPAWTTIATRGMYEPSWTALPRATLTPDEAERQRIMGYLQTRIVRDGKFDALQVQAVTS